MSNEKSRITFNGVDGISCHDFIQAIRQHAFDEGRTRDYAWIADLASLRFSGPALKWFESLDDATQEDWKLLKRAILRQYAEPTYEAAMNEPTAGDIQVFTFEGREEDNVQRFIQAIRQHAFTTGKLHDDVWMADLASTLLLGPAFEWHSKLAPNTRSNWTLLEKALTQSFDPPVQSWGLDAKRISIRDWEPGVRASCLRLPKSEEEWLAQGRRRRAEMSSSPPWSVAWFLVEEGEQIPPHSIPMGSEEGGHLFSIRVWKEGGLTLGKHGRHHSQGYIPWYNKELPWKGPYEILVGDQTAVRWVSPGEGSFAAVEGGYEATFPAALLIAQTEMEGTLQPGKAFSGDRGAYFGWRWDEHWRWNNDVKILAWAM
ncbi:hypothetical protein FRC05_006842 [Tulasnella sp. 425]|nr:hypothetical protein FRC05_006842 [Tulasnella sp. 425]